MHPTLPISGNTGRATLFMTIRPLYILALLIATIINTAAPQSRRQTTRRHLLIEQRTKNPSPLDTIVPADTAIRISGFEKPLRSSRESAFFTNTTDLHIRAVILTLTYTDIAGRTLHLLHTRIDTDLPPLSTRQYDWRSWDCQQAFHYRLSAKPRRAQGSPFDVKCSVDSIITDATSR